MIISILFAGEIIENIENFTINDLKDIHNKLLENKNILDSDKNLKVYEKMFILIDIYIYLIYYMKKIIEYIIYIKITLKKKVLCIMHLNFEIIL